MKLFFYSKCGESAGLAYRCQNEGNEVWLYIDDKASRPCLQGIVNQVNSLYEGLSKKPDVIVFDTTGNGDIAIRLKKQGFKVVGSGAVYKGKSFEDEIELDRSLGLDIMKYNGILIPETVEFKGSKDIEKAKQHIKKSNKRYVIKIDNNKIPSSSYVSDSPEDMIAHLDYIKKQNCLKMGDDFILQEFIKGVELSTEMWFSKGNPVYPANGTMETKKFMADDLGANTGCSTSLVWCYKVPEPKIVQMTLKKIFPLLKQVEYTGCIDINCIISEEDHKPYGLEWTPRMGYSAIYAFTKLFNSDVAEVLYGIASGTMKEFDVKDGYGYAIRVTIPPAPLSIKDEKLREKIFKETAGQRVNYEGDPDCIFPIEIRLSKDDEFETAGVDGEICEIVGYGKTIEESRDEAHENFEKLDIPDKQARLDGLKRPSEQLPKLRNWGYEV